VGLIIWSAIIGAWSLSMTPKGKSFLRRLLDRAQSRGEYLAGMTKSTSTKEVSDDNVQKNGEADQGDDADLVK